ncbi:hypothetical protein [Curtobacterium sp. MCBD17_003]|uniref:hypothetical protein n=1 Tax=Curtobacterium sp. MCBD17_003 TaxID=2175667 RepID=UPI000DA87862|nr:hypothetical protein [Curtobacterium sp. MCBD17_003]WIE54204.1 hypothetical protein DEI88_013930 [Curtobacterium sp. MCBD17_003]
MPIVASPARALRRSRQRYARTATLTVCSNVRRAARSQHIGPLTLARRARISFARTLRIWLGVRPMVVDLMCAQMALGMSVADVFEGTR